MAVPGGRVRVILLLAIAAAFSGCVAEMVERKKPRKGPVPEVGYVDQGGGELRYSAEGWGIVVSSRRRTALRRMRKVCKSKSKDLYAKITDEYTHQDADAIYSGEELADNMEKGLEHYKVALYHHIVFECKQTEKAPAAPAEDKKK